MKSFVAEIKRMFPTVFVHVIKTGTTDQEDSSSGLFGSMEKQVAMVCAQVKDVVELRHGFDAIGLSQGGQLMRAYVQMCDGPQVRRLLTFGSQHGGISSISSLASRLHVGSLSDAILQLVYTARIQRLFLPAQYIRVPSQWDEYIRAKPYIARINGEATGFKDDHEYGRDRMLKLQKFAMFMFQKDSVVQPRESSHFAMDSMTGVVPFTETAMYKSDWIGLKTLHNQRRLQMATVPDADHLQLGTHFLRTTLPPLLETDGEEDFYRYY